MLKVRSETEQQKLYKSLRKKYSEKSFHGLRYKTFKSYQLSTQIGHLLNSHTKYINISKNRTGDLFEGRFKRKEIDSELYLAQIICYIHRNPIHHRISEEYDLYPYSSYNELISETITLLNKTCVSEIFGTKENYISAHDEFKNLLGEDYLLEK